MLSRLLFRKRLLALIFILIVFEVNTFSNRLSVQETIARWEEIIHMRLCRTEFDGSTNKATFAWHLMADGSDGDVFANFSRLILWSTRRVFRLSAFQNRGIVGLVFITRSSSIQLRCALEVFSSRLNFLYGTHLISFVFPLTKHEWFTTCGRSRSGSSWTNLRKFYRVTSSTVCSWSTVAQVQGVWL